jgi:Flp pilus assembly protein TadD
MTNNALLEAGLTAARAGDLEEAARLFARLVSEDPSSEQGWLGLSLCLSDIIKREYCLRRVL